MILIPNRIELTERIEWNTEAPSNVESTLGIGYSASVLWQLSDGIWRAVDLLIRDNSSCL